MDVTPELLLRAYAAGLFPMAESADSRELFWFDPPLRGILPLEGFHVPRRLRRTVRRRPYRIAYDTDFEGVVAGCAEPTPDRPKTWINGEILGLYSRLFALGYAHSVECWSDEPEDGGPRLVGGLYGVALRGAFFGERMFIRATDASKIALVHLVALLRDGGFRLLDTQFMTDHLARFGGVEIPQADYKDRLDDALGVVGRFRPERDAEAVAALLGDGS